MILIYASNTGRFLASPGICLSTGNQEAVQYRESAVKRAVRSLAFLSQAEADLVPKIVYLWW